MNRTREIIETSYSFNQLVETSRQQGRIRRHNSAKEFGNYLFTLSKFSSYEIQVHLEGDFLFKESTCNVIGILNT